MPTRTRARRKAKASASECAQPTKEEIVGGLVKSVAGEAGAKILQNIGDGATDESIEKKSGLKLAQVRSLLNHLHSYGLVEYTREKNMQTGWFTYTWKLNMERFLHNFLTIKKKEYEGLREKLTSAEGAQFYKCKKNCVRLPFDQALELKFKCPACRKSLEFTSSEKELADLEHHIGALNNVLERQQPKPQLGVAR